MPLHLNKLSQKTITWGIEPTKALGGNPSADEIVNYVVSRVRPGSINLIHPW